jgi:hypothetical protein
VALLWQVGWPSAQRPGSGIRAEDSSYSLLSFTRKAGQGVGGGLAAYSIGLGGYISEAATQTSSAVTSIRVGGSRASRRRNRGGGGDAGLPAD